MRVVGALAAVAVPPAAVASAATSTPQPGPPATYELPAVVAFTALFVTLLSDGAELLIAPFSDTLAIRDETAVALLGGAWRIVGLRLRGAGR